MVPFTGAALSLRDMLRGEAQPCTDRHDGQPPRLDRPARYRPGAQSARRTGLSTADESLRPQRMGPRATACAGIAGVLAVYIVGGWLQTRFGMDGLGYTLWLMLLPLGILAAWRGVRARVGGDPETGAVTEELGLGLCSPYHGLAALLLVPAANLLMTALGVWQEEWLPLPRAMQVAGRHGPVRQPQPLHARVPRRYQPRRVRRGVLPRCRARQPATRHVETQGDLLAGAVLRRRPRIALSPAAHVPLGPGARQHAPARAQPLARDALPRRLQHPARRAVEGMGARARTGSSDPRAIPVGRRDVRGRGGPVVPARAQVADGSER
ncbi:MAG: hypothetical protein R3F17_16065 [Planctomycetota bacterium]